MYRSRDSAWITFSGTSIRPAACMSISHSDFWTQVGIPTLKGPPLTSLSGTRV